MPLLARLPKVSKILCAGLLVFAAGAATPMAIAPQNAATAQTTAPNQGTGEKPCTDAMETVPGYDDSEPVAVADTVDGACLASPAPVSI